MQEIKQYGNSRLEKFANIARNCSFKSSNLFDDEVLGSITDISNFSMQDVRKFLNTHLVKENISILIAGNKHSLYQIKSILNRYNLRKATFSSLIINSSESQSLSLEKIIIGNQKNKELAQLSTIFKICHKPLNENKILALSMLFSILNSGKYSLLSQMQHFVPELYFFQAIPIFRKSGIYIQLLTSCSIQDTKVIEENINKIFVTLSNLSVATLKDIIHNLYFHQNLLFDGVEKSISSFANMQAEQEKIINLHNIDSIATINKFKEIVNKLIDHAGSTVIAYI
ncbi:hypothetical protein [Lactobacillus sp. PV034]|uniref:hypothetical protein n=1 Tax=Lactobacillus sp. PV034 TaxID=2594495 RepID=UPI00223F6EB6|nr:hypothetical protein [Lactobacillus sp. PV034]QNQ81165.1 insulinase family protein [Lactobacillus sp. PV034]